MNRYSLFPLLTVVVLSLLLLACGGGGAATEAVPTSEPVQQTEATQPPTATPEPPTPTETPHELTVTDVAFYRDASDTMHVVGKVTNFTEKTASYVEIGATLLDASGEVVAKESGYTAADLLLPGQSDYFDVPFYEEVGEVAQATAEIADYDVESEPYESQSVELQGVSLRYVEAEGLLYVTGELVNANAEPVYITGIGIGALRDGKLVGGGEANIFPRLLMAGESGPFLVTVSGQNLRDAQPDMLISAVKSDATFDYRFDFPGIASFYADEFGDYHLVGLVTNGNEVPMSLSLIAAVYDADGNVLDVNRINVPCDPLPPGETVPFDFILWDLLDFEDGVGEQVASYTVMVDEDWTWEVDYAPFPVEAVLEQQEVDEGSMTLYGSITNRADQDAGAVLVIATLYDADGDIVATAYSYEDGGLSADGTRDFSPITVELPVDVDAASLTVGLVAYGQPVD